MRDNKMTPEQESKLFDDMEALKKESNTINTTVALMEQQLTYLISSIKEFGNLATQDEVNAINERVKTLESEKVRQDAINELRLERRNWWSNNWYKVVGLLIVAVPVIATAYNIFKDAGK